MTSSDNQSDRLDRAWSHYRRADQLDDEGKYEEALSECDRAIQLDSDFADAYNLRGVILEKMGFDGDAMREYKRAAGLDPGLTEAADNFKRLREKSTVRYDLVTIATFHHPTGAHLYKVKLESEGISAYVADEFVSTITWWQTMAFGGIKLQVAEPDVPRALSIMQQSGYGTHDMNQRLTRSEDRPQCPRCETPVVEQWEYCCNCGEPLYQVTGYTCSRCGKDVEEDWKECPFCGESLEEIEM